METVLLRQSMDKKCIDTVKNAVAVYCPGDRGNDSHALTRTSVS